MPSASGDDDVLPPSAVRAFLSEEVVVEEKLDGSNVMLWLDAGSGVVEVAGRAGPGAMDRARQLGPLRAWAGERDDELRTLLDGEQVLYAEWLWNTHGVAYESLPAFLVGLDLWNPDLGFATMTERDRQLTEAGLTIPPRIFSGVLGDLAALALLAPASRWSSQEAEGVVVRRTKRAAQPRAAKFVRPAFRPRSDASWRQATVRNRVAAL